MKSEPDKDDRIIGSVFGALLFIIWLVSMVFVENAIYPQQSFVHKPLITWLNYGLIPFFITAGNYMLYSRKKGGILKLQSMTMFKSSLLVFSIWLPVIGLFFIQSDIPYLANVLGGYLTITVVYLLWYRKETLKYPHLGSDRLNSD